MENVIKCEPICPVKYNGKWREIGKEVELPESIAKALLNHKDGAKVRILDGEKDLSDKPETASGEASVLFDGLTKEEILEELLEVDEVNEDYALAFFNMGIYGVEALQEKEVKDLTPIKGLGKVTAQKIIDSASEFDIEE